MKYSRLFLIALAISLGCYGCSGDSAESGSCTGENCQTETECKCDDGSDCPNGDKNKCEDTLECKCDNGTDCPNGDKNKCEETQECKCDNGTDCPNGDKNKCEETQECKCDDGSDCPNGDKNNCEDTLECKCDDGTDCPNGDKNNCKTTSECTGEKPENAIDCECTDGNWTNCTYPGENQCTEVCDAQKLTKCGSEGVMKCESDANGCAVWTTIEPCNANSHCDETQLKCVDNCSSACDVTAPAKCDNGNVVTCKKDASGCASYQTTTCDKGTYCDAEKAACVPCKETCTAAKRCSSSGVESCTPDAHGCAVWTVTEPCNANQSCDASKLKCTDACNPACKPWQVCINGNCECDATMPAGWPSELTALDYPLMVPSSSASYGSDNIYAPDIHKVSNQRVMWYGAQGKDGNDRIFVATSSNGAEWHKYPSNSDPKPVLDRGTSNHVNDPSLVYVNGKWKMYYTDAKTAEDDLIWLAESSKLSDFKKIQKVLGLEGAQPWESKKVGRPSVLYEDGVYKMWYDGQDGTARHVGYATSTDGIHFTRHEANPVLKNAGAIDVDKIGGVYVMLMEGHEGTYWATSVNGICWVPRGLLFKISGKSYDAHGQVTPFLEVEDGQLRGIWFGGASVASWNHNRIGAAYAPGKAPSGGGCSACVSPGLTCTDACQNAGAGTAGSCGNPGSSSAGACCACSADKCAGCLVGAKDCNQACINNGKSGGYCAHPDSTDSGKCCACLD